jgi:hypothetical protein
MTLVRDMALAAVLLALAACAGKPVRDARAPAGARTAAQAAEPAIPAAGDALAQNGLGPLSSTEVVAPCLPVQLIAQPKPRSKPKPKVVPKQSPPSPPETHVAEVEPSGAIDADVKVLSNSVVSILGKSVRGLQGEDLGRVVDVLADAGGRVRVAIIDFGGFLGIGNRRIAVDWRLLRFDPADQDKPLILSISREKLQAAPEYKDSSHPQALIVPSTPAATQ